MTNNQIESINHSLHTPSQRWEFIQTQATTPLAQTLLNQWAQQAWTLVETQLAKHPFLQERPTFKHRYTYALWYHILTLAKQHNVLPTKSLHQLTQTLNLPHETVRSWILGYKTTSLLTSINKLDQTHQRLTHSYPTEALQHRLNPSHVYTHFKPLHDTPKHIPNRPQQIATAIQHLHTTHPLKTPVVFAELRPCHPNGPSWLRTIAQEIHHHLHEIQHQLTTTINNKTLRIGVANNILYIWEKTDNPDNWLNIYADELIHLPSPKAKRQLVETVRRHLLIQKQGLSRLITQLTNRSRDSYHPASRIRALHYRYSYLLGSSLHFLLDTTGQDLNDIQIDRIGRGSQGYGYIHEPRFPQGEELNEFRARALAIILSDGTIDAAGILKYSEKSRSRRNYVKNLFSATLGKIDTNDRDYTLRFPVVVGRILQRWGVPIGDKIIQAVHLPETVLYGNNRIRCAYLQEVVPEDGAFGVYKNKARFLIGRTKVLDAGEKTEQYNFTSLISDELKEVFTNLATKNARKKEHDTLAHYVMSLTWGKLKEKSKTSQHEQLSEKVEQLKKLVRMNPPELLADEKSLLESIGIKSRMVPVRITLFETGRISVSWELVTRRRNEVIKWALLAPPSSGRKRKDVEIWLSRNLEQTRPVKGS